MANKEVVTARMRSQLQRVLTQLAHDKGNLSLAMLVSADLPERWDLVVSAPWMDSLSPRSVISDLTSRLLRLVDRNSLAVIDRVSVMPGSDPFVRRVLDVLNEFLGVDATKHKGGFRLHDMVVEGRDIPEAFVFVASPSTNGRLSNSLLASQKFVSR